MNFDRYTVEKNKINITIAEIEIEMLNTKRDLLILENQIKQAEEDAAEKIKSLKEQFKKSEKSADEKITFLKERVDKLNAVADNLHDEYINSTDPEF